MQLLHGADAAVLPSHYEPFGIVALEAAATGAPLVTSNVGGLGEAVINGETGVSFPPRDVAALAAAVRVVLDDPAGGATARDRGTQPADVGVRLAHRRRRNSRRCIWPPNAVNANHIPQAGRSSSTRCPTADGSTGVEPFRT